MTDQSWPKAGCRIPYREALEQLPGALVQALERSPELVRVYTSYLAQAMGKGIRGQALLASAMDQDQTVGQGALDAAVGIELFHLATLVHDDIIDQAESRRGQASLHRQFGTRQAVICGDYLLTLAADYLRKEELSETYRGYPIRNFSRILVMAELQQQKHQFDLDISALRYLAIIRGKTAVLFEAAMLYGAMQAGEEKHRLPLWQRLGRYIGMIFQMSDDCLDYESSKEAAGKPVLADYQNGVITLPLIHALRSRPSLKKIAQTRQESSSSWIAQQVAEQGGLFYTRQLSKRYALKAQRILKQLDLSADKRQALLEVLEKSQGRAR